MPTIEIIVSPQGNTKITTKGFAGRKCQDATRELERALGAKTSDRKTIEFYTHTITEPRQRTGN